MSELVDPKTLPKTLADLRADAELPDQEFRGRHGEAFLLHHGPIGAAQPERMLRTRVMEPARATPSSSHAAGFLVFSVKRTGRSPFPFFISVGRTENNDIVIHDASLSKFHAYFKHEDGGGYFIQDSGSSNGTFLDDKPVPKKEDGEAVEVRSGARLRFGRVELTFLGADELRRMLKSRPA